MARWLCTRAYARRRVSDLSNFKPRSYRARVQCGPRLFLKCRKSSTLSQSTNGATSRPQGRCLRLFIPCQRDTRSNHCLWRACLCRLGHIPLRKHCTCVYTQRKGATYSIRSEGAERPPPTISSNANTSGCIQRYGQNELPSSSICRR